MKNKTKIVATIGPATQNQEVMEQMVATGMNVARFNTKHSTPKWHNRYVHQVKDIAKKLKKPVAVLVDLQGPEVRVETPHEKAIPLKRGEKIYFTSDPNLKHTPKVIIPQLVIEALSKDNEIVLDDGSCEFQVTEKSGNYLIAHSQMECQVEHRKTMNTPGVILNMPSLTERDLSFLDEIDGKLIDFVALSFVRGTQDIDILKAELEKRKIQAGIVPKIENQAALDNLDEIIAVSDAIMIARGDLGVEVDLRELTYWQKVIIEKCRQASKPVITATQMLKSMVSNPRPTRAEVSDVANAIYDGTDAVMLSEETTIGRYPIKTVGIQAKIAAFNEPYAANSLYVEQDEDLTTAITHSAVEFLQRSTIQIDKIVCLTETGTTARLVSRFRPTLEIIAITNSMSVYHRLSLSFGVRPHFFKTDDHQKIGFKHLTEALKESGALIVGERVIFIHGKNLLKGALTNTLSILEIT